MRIVFFVALLMTVACPLVRAASGGSGYLLGLTVNLGETQGQTQEPVFLKYEKNGSMRNVSKKKWLGSSNTPNGISRLELSTGNVSLVRTFEDVYHCTETSYDDSEKVLYLLINGNTLMPYSVTEDKFMPSVTVDASDCDQGQPCFSEMHYDTENKRLLAIGVGYPQGKGNSIVAIDQKVGK